MPGFIPDIIADHTSDSAHEEQREAHVLFFDISGFTAMTSSLMQYGKEGAEVLSEILSRVFGMVVDVIYDEKGFITTFAGDAATAVFFAQGSVFQAASRIRDIFDRYHLQRTPFGEFPLDVKMGLDFGTITWNIYNLKTHNTYLFHGPPIDGASQAEKEAAGRQIIITGNTKEVPADFGEKPLDSSSGFRIIQPREKPGGKHPKQSRSKDHAFGPDRKDIESRYYPLNKIDTISSGEFRNISSVFISLHDMDLSQELPGILNIVLFECSEYGGYFNLLDYGDKGIIALVLFGAPVSHEDDAPRAAAFSMRLRSRLGTRVRIGISTGRAYTGIIGSSRRKTYTALGSVVNLSARIALDSKWGDINISGSTEKRTRESHVVSAGESKSFKGFEKALPVFRLIDSRVSQNISDTDDLFIGRENELRSLRQWMENTQDGFQGIFYLYGSAGTGKSHLVNFAVNAGTGAIKVLRLFTDTILRKSMNPFVSLLENELGLRNPSTYMEFKDALDKYIASLPENQDLEEFTRQSPALASVLGLDVQEDSWERLDPRGRFEMIRSSLAGLIDQISKSSPLVLIIEDAHALDADSLSVLDMIVSSLQNNMFGVLLVGREGDNEVLESLLNREDILFTELHVGPLTHEDARRLASRVLGGEVDQELMKFFEIKTGYNPLFLKELIYHLRNEHIFSVKNGRYVLDNENSEIPLSLSSIMVSRIDRLDEELKDLVLLSSVMGLEFNSDILKELADKKNIDQLLEEGLRQGIWQEISKPDYAFKQPLLQEAAYSMQFEARLKELHRIIASQVARSFPDNPRYYADVVYHYSRAGIKEETITYLEKVIDYTVGSYKNEKALEFIDHYLRLVDDENERIRMYRKKGDIYELTGRWDQAVDSLTYGLGTSVIGMLNAEKADFLTSLGTIYQKQGLSEKAVFVLSQAIELSLQENETPVTAEAYISQGRAYWSLGRYGEAKDVLKKAIIASRETGNREMEALAYYYEGVVYRDTNHYDEAVSRYEQSLKIFQKLKNDRLTTYPLYDLGVVYQYQGRLDESQEYFQRSANVYEQIGYKSGLSAALLNLGVLQDRRGNFDEAIEYFIQARKIAEEMGEDLAIAYTVFSLGATYYKLHDYRKSSGYLRDAYRLMKKINALGYFGYALSYLASLYAADNNPEYAIRIAYLHVKNIQKVGSDVENGRTLLAVARVLQDGIDLDDDIIMRLKAIAQYAGIKKISPESFYKRSIAVAEKTSYMNTLIPARYNYAHYLYSRGKDPDARTQLEEALALAENSGWELMVNTIKRELGSKPDKCINC